MPRILLFCGLICVACAAQPSPQDLVQLRTGDSPAKIELTPYGPAGHKAVSVVIDDRAHEFIFDTGGGVTFVGPELASALGCGDYGRLTGFRMRGDRVDFGRCDNKMLTVDSLALAHDTLGIFDIGALLPPDWPALGGLISLSSFADHVVTLDLAHNRVEVGRSFDAPVQGSAKLRLVRQASGASIVVLVPVPSPRGTLWIELDSGSSAPLILAPHAARMLGLNLEGEGVEHIDAGGPEEAWKLPKVEIRLPGVGTIETPAKVMDIIYDGNLGAPLMERFVWTLDLAGERLSVSRSTETATPSARTNPRG